MAPQVPPASGASSVRPGDTHRCQSARTVERHSTVWVGSFFLSDPSQTVERGSTVRTLTPLPPKNVERNTVWGGAEPDPPHPNRLSWHAGRAARQDALQLGAGKEATTNSYAIDEDDSEDVEESAETEEDLQARCQLEESENEQWQEVISRRSKQRAKEANQASLLSVETSHFFFESEEDCGGERQVGESQSHHGLWSRRACDA